MLARIHRSRRVATTALIAGLLSLAACGGAQRTGGGARPLDRLRADAEDHPRDPRIALALATGEHLYDGGDPERARRALERAKALVSGDPRLLFLEAEQRVVEGEPQQALVAYLAVVAQAPTSTDPLARRLAELSLQSVLDMNDVTDDYRKQVGETLAKVHPSANKLGPEAGHQLRVALLNQAMQRGDVEAARTLAREAGCVQQAQVAGPFGPRELLGFDQKLAAEGHGPLAAEHDLGPGRGLQPVRTLETRRCVLGLGRGAHDALPGTSVLRAEIETHGPLHALRVEAPNSYVVFVDGKELARVDLRMHHQTGVRYVPLALAPGKHELKLKVSSRHPNPVVSLALIETSAGDVAATALGTPQDEFERYLLARLSLGRGDLVGARELLRKLGHRDPTAHWLVLEAASAMADPLKTPEQRRDRARELLGRAQRQNPRAWYPAIGIARLAAAEGRNKEAIEDLRAAMKTWPEATSIHTTLVELLRSEGYVEEADHLVEALTKQMPNACAVVGLALTTARNRGHAAEVAQLTERAMRCDASSTARLVLLKSQRKYPEAADELTRLSALGEPLDRAGQLESELERARLIGDAAKIAELTERRAALWSDRPAPVLEQTDALLARGEKQKAMAYLGRALDAQPGDLSELRRVQDALTPDALFKGFRKRTDEVIRAFEASKQDYDDPQVLVLDYTAVRVFEDGSSIDLTHNIMRVQSQEAVDQNGEFAVPEGARLLTLHTIKPDGTRVEPDPIPGKSTWSLPNLAPGDYVESEFVRGEAPSVGFPGGFLGDRFYFKSFEVPFDHSELAVIMPASMQPTLDPRGPLPELQSERRGDLKVLRWTSRQSRALAPEPSSVAQREFLPSINLGMKVSWEAYVESLRDLLVDKDVYDPAAQEFVSQLLGAQVNAPASARTRVLHRWVTDQIEATQDVFGSAAAMLSARTGSRERVLKYMLALAHIDSELVLARGAEADHSQATLPDPETYGHLLLRVATEQGPLFVDTTTRHAPLELLPAGVRGEQALIVNPRAERAQLPSPPIESDLRSIDVDATLAADGTGTLHVRETHVGASAADWRNDLESIPAAELSARFEQGYVVNRIPGARLEKLAIEGRDDPEAPLVLAYHVEVSDLGQRVGNQQRIGALYPNMLSAQYARQGSRTFTQIVAPSQAIDIRTRLTLPKGARVVSLPKAGKLRGENASFGAIAEQNERELTLTRTLRLPIARVEPAAYPGFASFCRGVDALEASELVLELPED